MAFESTSSAGQGKRKKKILKSLNSKSDVKNFICVRNFSLERQGAQIQNYCIKPEFDLGTSHKYGNSIDSLTF